MSGQLAEFVPRKSLLGMGEKELIREIGAEEGWIVGVERDQKTNVEVLAERVDVEGRADASADIRSRIQLEGDALRFQVLEEFRVMNCRKGVADALGANREGLPYSLGTGGFASVVGEPKAGGLGARKEVAEWLGAGAPLVSAEPDADDGRVEFPHLRSLAKDAIGLFDGEMADSVEDPVEGEAKLTGGAEAGALQTLENRLEAAGIEVAPHIDDANRDVDLGVNDALLGEMLHHVPRHELIVFGVAETARDGFEGFNEFGEIREAVERLGIVMSEGYGIVAGAELDEGGRRDGAFKVKVELRLGQAANEVLN